MHLSLEEVAVCAGQEVLMIVDFYFTDCGGDPWGILGQKLRPHLIHLPNLIVIILISYIIIKLLIKKEKSETEPLSNWCKCFNTLCIV